MRAAHALAIVATASLAASCARSYEEVEIDLRAVEPRVDEPGPPSGALRFSVAAMQSARSTYDSYTPLTARMGRLIGTDFELVQRRTYGEVNAMLVDGELDLAFICTGAWLSLQHDAPGATELLAIPVIRGSVSYRSYLIVPAGGSARELEDLRGQRFAVTDELSLTGSAYPSHMLAERGTTPGSFFGSMISTNSHDRSILAIAGGLADGAAVDGLIYEDMLESRPELAAEVRVIHRSAPYGMPPFVASTRIPIATRERLRAVLLSLHEDRAAAAAMRDLHIDRFVVPEPDAYESAAHVVANRR